MPKRIILCLDGTWDSADSGSPALPSNVARLSRMIARQGISAKGQAIEQVVYYQSGVGTGDVNRWDRVYQGITGSGIIMHLMAAYNFVATNYAPGDEIFLFGYSRGAYTARALGWFLTKVGVLKPEDLDLFPGLFKCFKKGDGKVVFSDDSPDEELRGWTGAGVAERNSEGSRENRGKGTLKPRTRIKTKPVLVDIRVEGVWETVGSLGLPESWFTKMTGFNKLYRFYNTALDDQVHHAFQALALDEHRGAFTPAIWYLEPKFKDRVDLKQCWFPGYHGEVGGGVAGPAGRNYLAVEDVTLAWMCDQVDGLITFDEEASRNILGEVDENAKWSLWRESDPTGGIWNLSVAGGRTHQRRPGSYHQSIPRALEAGQFTTNETIHPTAKLLIDASQGTYFPLGLNSRTTLKKVEIPRWKFVDKSDSGQGAVWTRPAFPTKPGKGMVEIKEHVIKEKPDRNNFEAKLLPVAVQDMLYRRNLEEFDLMYQSSFNCDESI